MDHIICKLRIYQYKVEQTGLTLGSTTRVYKFRKFQIMQTVKITVIWINE